MSSGVSTYKKYTNKVWNVARFIISADPTLELTHKPTLAPRDEEALKELDATIAYVTEHIAAYKLYLAAEHLYHYTWHTLADIRIEERKDALMGSDVVAKESATWTLRHILEEILKLHHPFMPFVTEEIWQSLPGKRKPLIITPWRRF